MSKVKLTEEDARDRSRWRDLFPVVTNGKSQSKKSFCSTLKATKSVVLAPDIGLGFYQTHLSVV